MTIREQIEQVGKELLTLAGLQADLEGRVKATTEHLEILKKELDSELDIVQHERYKK